MEGTASKKESFIPPSSAIQQTVAQRTHHLNVVAAPSLPAAVSA
ncbi:hypothetical protein ACFOGG_14155 [Brenneria rubrifaciens]